MRTPHSKKIAKGIAYGAIGLVVLLTGILAAAVLFLQGERLAALIHAVLPEQKGTMRFQAIRFRPRLLVDLVADRPTPLVVHGLRIVDPEGTLVLDVPHLEVSVRLLPLITGEGILLSDLKVGPNSLWLFGKMKKLEGIGFLTALNPKNASPAPPEPKGKEKSKGSVFQIVNAELNGFRAIFDFPGSWGLDLRDIHAPASVLVDADGFVGWDVPNLEARQGGYLRVLTEELPFDRVEVTRVATTKEWPDDIFLDLKAAKTQGTTLSGKGFFTGIYGENSVSGIKIHAEFNNAADALQAVAKPHNLVGLRLSGEKANVAADLFGPYETLQIKAGISGLDVAYDSYGAKDLALQASVAFSPTEPTMRVTVDRLAFASPDGGTFSSHLALIGDELSAQFAFKEFKTSSYLPESLRMLAAGTLDGKLGIKAGIGVAKRLNLQGLDLRYTRRTDHLPKEIRVRGEATANEDEVRSKALRIEIPGANAEIEGKVALAKRTLGVAMRLSAAGLPDLLARSGIPPWAKRAEAFLNVSGSLDQPDAQGGLDLAGIGGGNSGIPSVERFSTRFHMTRGKMVLDSLLANVAKGTLSGKGASQLFGEKLTGLLAAPTLDFQLEGKNLSLADLLADGILTGKVSFKAGIAGSTRKPRLHFTLPKNTQVTVFGHPWTIDGIDLEASETAVHVRLCQIRNPQGGDLSIEGQMGLTGKAWPLHWKIRIRSLPLAAILASAQVSAPLEGFVSLDLDVQGTAKTPQISGTLSLSEVAVESVPLGKATFTFTPSDAPGVLVAGDLFGRLRLQAIASLTPAGYKLGADLTFNRLPIEDFLPGLKEEGIDTSLSGHIRLTLGTGLPPFVDVNLDQIEARVMQASAQAGKSPDEHRFWIKNGNPLHASLSGDTITLDPFHLLTQAGAFSLAAKLTNAGGSEKNANVLDAQLAGRIDLELLQPFLREQLSTLSGSIALSVNAKGPLAAPQVQGTLAIVRPVAAEPRAVAMPIKIPSGTLQLDPTSISLSNFSLETDGSLLQIAGSIGLAKGFRPTTLALETSGTLHARLLETLVPSAISDVAGIASVTARVSGTVQDPQIAARVRLAGIQMRLRGLQGQVEIEDGRIEVTSKEILLSDLRLKVANDGNLRIGTRRPGRVRLLQFYPAFKWSDIDLPVSGEGLSYRTEAIEINDLAFDFELQGGPEEGLGLTGDIRLISGRYLQDFSVRNLILSPNRLDESDSRPIWADLPLLETLALDLRVRTVGDSFIVQNNLAPEIHILVDLGVGGTLALPALSGEIRPTDGRFHILGLRGDFELIPNVSHVTFVPTKSIDAGDTPELNLQAQNDLLDAAGNEHTVIMHIHGPIGQSTIDVSTTSGMDRNQTMLLLLSGRTTDDLSGNGGPIFGMNSESTLSVFGQASRDAVSNFIEPYIDDTLQMLTGRKWNLRPTIGADAFELRVGARTSREFHLELSYLQGFQGQKRYQGEGRLWFQDYITFRMIGERLTYSLQQGIIQETDVFRLELTLDYPLRFPFWP